MLFFRSGYSKIALIGWRFLLLGTSVLAKPHFWFSPTTIPRSNFVRFDSTFLATAASPADCLFLMKYEP